MVFSILQNFITITTPIYIFITPKETLYALAVTFRFFPIPHLQVVTPNPYNVLNILRLFSPEHNHRALTSNGILILCIMFITVLQGFFFLLNRLFLRVVLDSQQNGTECRDFSYAPCLHPSTASPTVSIRHQRGAFVTIQEPALTHRPHPVPIVYIEVHSVGLD